MLPLHRGAKGLFCPPKNGDVRDDGELGKICASLHQRKLNLLRDGLCMRNHYLYSVDMAIGGVGGKARWGMTAPVFGNCSILSFVQLKKRPCYFWVNVFSLII